MNNDMPAIIQRSLDAIDLHAAYDMSRGMSTTDVALNRTLSAHGLAAPVMPTAEGADVLHEGGLDFMLTRRLNGRLGRIKHAKSDPAG